MWFVNCVKIESMLINRYQSECFSISFSQVKGDISHFPFPEKFIEIL